MKLIMICGPPAVGKLTVAKELSKLTGYKILHNYLVADFVGSIIEWDSEDFRRYLHKFKLQLIDAACKSKVHGIIYTFVYVPGSDNEKRINDILDIIKLNDGEVFIVQLNADDKTIGQRVDGKAKKKHKNIWDKITLMSVLSRDNYFEKFNFMNSIFINNTNLSAKKVAAKIFKDFTLKKE